MRRLIVLATTIASLAVLTACGDNTADNQVTETRMDDLDSLEGTITDDMINTDESTDEAPLDTPPATTTLDKAEKPKAKLDQAETIEPGNPDIDKTEPDPKAE